MEKKTKECAISYMINNNPVLAAKRLSNILNDSDVDMLCDKCPIKATLRDKEGLEKDHVGEEIYNLTITSINNIRIEFEYWNSRNSCYTYDLDIDEAKNYFDIEYI